MSAVAIGLATPAHADAPIADNAVLQALATPTHQKIEYTTDDKPTHKKSEIREAANNLDASLTRASKILTNAVVDDKRRKRYQRFIKERNHPRCPMITSGPSSYYVATVCEGDKADELNRQYKVTMHNGKMTKRLMSVLVQVEHKGRTICGYMRPNAITTTKVPIDSRPACKRVSEQKDNRSYVGKKGTFNGPDNAYVTGAPFELTKQCDRRMYRNYATEKPSPSNLFPTKDNVGFYDKIGRIDQDDNTGYRFQRKGNSPDGKAAVIVASTPGWGYVRDGGVKASGEPAIDCVRGVPQGGLKRTAQTKFGLRPFSAKEDTP